MEDLLRVLGCDPDEIEWILKDFKDKNIATVESALNLLIRYQCDKDFVKYIIFNHKSIFDMDLERIEYIIEAILSNGDIIEETLLELV